MERATEAKLYFDSFQKLMKAMCNKNNGYRFKAGVKIKDRSEVKALLRIKEKMLARNL